MNIRNYKLKKYFISSSGDRTHNQSILVTFSVTAPLLAFVYLLDNSILSYQQPMWHIVAPCLSEHNGCGFNSKLKKKKTFSLILQRKSSKKLLGYLHTTMGLFKYYVSSFFAVLLFTPVDYYISN